jgi:hypothetical protein
MEGETSELTKIRFRLDPNDWHGRPSETLWAEAVSGATAGSAFRLRNSPMFACGVSFLDIVRAARSADGEGLEFDVPAETDIYAAYSIFSDGERENVWIFQEGHVGHKLRS